MDLYMNTDKKEEKILKERISHHIVTSEAALL